MIEERKQHVLEDQVVCHLCLSFSLAFDKFHYVFRLTYASTKSSLRYAIPPMKPTITTTQRIIGLRFTYALSTYHVSHITYHTRNYAERRLSKLERCCCCCCCRRRRFDFVVLSYYDVRKYKEHI